MFGKGISLFDLSSLLTAIRSKDLILQVKITEGEWEDISQSVVKKMVQTITKGEVTSSDDIKLRLFAKTS